VEVFRSDNNGEYISKAFDDFLSKYGITRQTSSPCTPQQNGVAEHANRTILEMVRSMIHAQRLGHEFWAEAVCNAVYIRNRCPTKAVEGMTPEEAWSGRMPHVSYMRVFGCVTMRRCQIKGERSWTPRCQMFLSRILRRYEGVSAHLLEDEENH
jgi:transposase InsO family protein